MNWQSLFLSVDGRIGRKEFWIGVLILFVAHFVAIAFHILAPLIWMLLIYPWICVYAKRLHDFGKSAMTILLPFIVIFIACVLALVFGGIGVFGAIMAGNTDGQDASSWGALIGGFGAMLVCLAVAAAAKFIFLLWVGLNPGNAGPNRYGPEPGETASATA